MAFLHQYLLLEVTSLPVTLKPTESQFPSLSALLRAGSSLEKRLSCRSEIALIAEIGASAAAAVEYWSELKQMKLTLNRYSEKKVPRAGEAELCTG